MGFPEEVLGDLPVVAVRAETVCPLVVVDWAFLLPAGMFRKVLTLLAEVVV